MLLHLPKFRALTPGLLLLIMCLFAGKAHAQDPVSGTFTINSALPTDETNFQTFTEAVFSLAYGVNGPVIFNVAPGSGPYNEQVNISFIAGTSATNTVTFNGNGATLENASNNPIARAVLKLDGVSYVTINNFQIHAITTLADDSYGWGVALVRDADHNTIKNCTITIGQGSTFQPQNDIGIYMGSTDDFPNSNGISNCDYNIIDSNTIIGGYDGIDLNNYGGNFAIEFTTMDFNQVTNNTISGFLHSGIHIIWNKGTLVQGNDISVVQRQSVDGIIINEKNTLLKVNANRIHNISTDPSATNYNFKAIDITYCNADANTINTISNNVIYDISSIGAQYGINITSSSYFNIVHNTVVLDGPAAPSGSVTYGFQYDGANKNVNFKNNIISVQRTGAGTRRGLHIDEPGTNFISDYNDVIVAAGNNFGSFNGTSYAALANWQSGSGHDAHSASQDPLFTNVAVGNFKPTNAAIDNLGTFAGITSDVVGDIRNNNTPDLGAYEFLTPPCNTPVAGGTSIGIPAEAVCGGGLRTLNLSGNSFGTGQTYQWQTSATIDGTYSNVSGLLVVPVYDVNPVTDIYYRAVLTCGAGSATSTPILISVKHPLSGTYTINSAGTTAGTNFKTFADAISAFSCGVSGPVTLNVVAGSGPYNEQVVFNTIAGVSATNTITLNGNGATLTYLSTNFDERATLKLNGTDWMIIENLNVIAQGASSGQYAFGIQLLNDADHNIIRNCNVTTNLTSTSSNSAGILINGSATDAIGGDNNKCDFNKITGNTVTGGYYGIVAWSDPAIAKMNFDTISNNIVNDQHVYGIIVRGMDQGAIEGNDISRPARLVTGSYIGIYLNGISTSLAVSKNKIHKTHGVITTGTDATIAISSNNCDATAGNEVIISNNVIYDFGGLGAQTGLNNTSSDYNLYYHNTISFERAVGTPTTTARAIYQTTASTGIEYRNNNVVIKRNGTGTNHAIYMNTTGTTYTASNNNYFVAGTGTNRTGFRNSVQYTTLQQWQDGSATDANSTALDPVWPGVASGDLSPANLALDNKGINANITTDINGLTRSVTTPDIGAYEFTGVLPVKLISFNANATGTDAAITWATATELNTHHFIVQRSANGNNFTDAGEVAATGNSNTTRYYNFKDINAAAISNILYYRLKIVDNDGRIEYSNVAAIQFGQQQTVQVGVAPNPFVSSLTARIVTASKGTAVIRINDVAGRSLLLQTQTVGAGTTVINIDKVNQLPAGVYFVTIELNGNKYVQKVVK